MILFILMLSLPAHMLSGLGFIRSPILKLGKETEATLLSLKSQIFQFFFVRLDRNYF